MSTASELLSTTQLKERIAQELQRCTQLTAEQEDAKRGRDDAQERQRLRRDLENERASTALRFLPAGTLMAVLPPTLESIIAVLEVGTWMYGTPRM